MKSDAAEHHALASVATLLAHTIQSYGLDFRLLLRQVGIDPDHYSDPDERLPIVKLQQLWSLATEASGDPCIGLQYAYYIQPASLHGMGLAWASSDTLLDGVKRLIRYQSIVSTALDITLSETSGGYQLDFESKAARAPVAASIDATLAAFIRMCRITTGPSINPRAVTLRHSAPSCQERFLKFFAAPVEFQAEADSILFDKHTLESKIPSAHPELARVNDGLVYNYLKRLYKNDLTGRVRKQIVEHLPNGIPKQKLIAHKLNLSLRNLQRKLKGEGTTFKCLIDETRKELAIEYLTTSNKPLIEIGYLLGFTESSNFSRAFRRWTGKSPQQYRNNI
ncbi:MAG: AraC family transcriptional regulator [Candidatus Thiodiazotropha sp. (ex Monitilora ramsayi)]|nr:AraC family transcriptional regulator [Candidatus Thiodiazotropha sp. (ex Monitilora ramsayi)]